MAGPQTIMCPSAACEDGALLLGRQGANGVVAFATRPVRLDAKAASGLRAAGDPERAFRFASPCARSGCAQWGQGRCGVIDLVLAAPQDIPVPDVLPPCIIRPGLPVVRPERGRGVRGVPLRRYRQRRGIGAHAEPPGLTSGLAMGRSRSRARRAS